MRYCLQCGDGLEFRLLDGRNREVCGKCGWIYYPQLKVGVGVLIEKDSRLLLLQRAHKPWKDCWNLPAGYVEVDENPRDAAKREVFEETALSVEVGELFQMYYFDDDPRGNGIMLLYEAKSVSGQLKYNDEVKSARYFSWQDIPNELTGAGDDRAIWEWRERARKKHDR